MERTIHLYDKQNLPSLEKQQKIVEFLYLHLGKYGDPKPAIEKCLAYALDSNEAKGGFVITIENENKILAATIVNKTGMEEFIPENILVYVAAHNEFRGIGLGSQILKEALNHAEGDVALHVEHNNPAKALYEKLGFTNPYLEMRFKK